MDSSVQDRESSSIGARHGYSVFAGEWDAARPVRRRQPIAARRAWCGAWLKASDAGTRGASFKDAEGLGRVLRECGDRLGPGLPV